jgi:hypothetical protein
VDHQTDGRVVDHHEHSTRVQSVETLNIAELRRLMRPSSAHSATGGVLFLFAWAGFADSVMPST